MSYLDALGLDQKPQACTCCKHVFSFMRHPRKTPVDGERERPFIKLDWPLAAWAVSQARCSIADKRQRNATRALR